MVETFPLEWSISPLRYQLVVIGGSPAVTLQIMVIINPSIVYAGAPILTVMIPFSTVSCSDPPLAITMATKVRM